MSTDKRVHCNLNYDRSIPVESQTGTGLGSVATEPGPPPHSTVCCHPPTNSATGYNVQQFDTNNILHTHKIKNVLSSTIRSDV